MPSLAACSFPLTGTTGHGKTHWIFLLLIWIQKFLFKYQHLGTLLWPKWLELQIGKQNWKCRELLQIVQRVKWGLSSQGRGSECDFSYSSVQLGVCQWNQHEALHPAFSYREAISCSAHLLTLTARGLAVKTMRNFNLGRSLHSKHIYLICFLLAVQSELRMDSCLRHNRGLPNKKQRVLKCQRAIPRLVSNDLVMQNVLLHQLHLTSDASMASLLPYVLRSTRAL